MMSACSEENPMTATMLERSPDLWSQWQDGKESMLDTIRKTLDTAVEDEPANGVYRVSRGAARGDRSSHGVCRRNCASR
jgi:hypothetical protein